MNNPADFDGLLHVFPQSHWHDEAYVVGDRDGLERLRTAIDKALSTGQGKCQSFTNDGEGYTVEVKLADKGQMEKLAVPYVDDAAKEPENSAAIRPWAM